MSVGLLMHFGSSFSIVVICSYGKTMTSGTYSSMKFASWSLDLGRKMVNSSPFRMLMNLFYLALILFRMIIYSSTCSVFS